MFTRVHWSFGRTEELTQETLNFIGRLNFPSKLPKKELTKEMEQEMRLPGYPTPKKFPLFHLINSDVTQDGGINTFDLEVSKQFGI